MLFLLFLAGCGGGNNSQSVATGGQGRATLTVQWPTRSRLIPDASNSINVVINQGTTVVAHQTLARPAMGGTSTATFASLPTGALSATATAYPNTDGTGVVQATGTVSLVIVANQATSFSITMASTITHLDLTAPNATINAGAKLQIVATAKDTSGAMVLTTPGRLTWLSSASGVATVDGNGLVTGLSAGSTDISVTDTESGKAAKTTITVKSGGPFSFAPPVIYNVNAPNEIVAADVDGDGKIDIVVGTSGSLQILYGKGDGTFETPQTILTWSGGIKPYSAADMNGDGKLDIICTASTQVLVINNLGSRNFAAPIAIPCGFELGPLVTADFNGDGKPDIAVAVANHPGSSASDAFIFRNQGGGVFVQGPSVTSFWIIGGLKAADLNGDGKIDLLCSITTDIVGRSGTNVWLGDGAGSFTFAGGTDTGTGSVIQTAIADFNGDGKLDVAIANYSDATISAILNTGNGTFGVPATYGGIVNPDHMTAADMDGDGHPDIIIQNRDTAYFTVMRDQNGLFPNQSKFPSGVPCGPLTVADLNGDGKPDVIISNYNGNGVAVILNNAP